MTESLSRHRVGPLAHLTVVEFAGLGPAPFAGMMLADLGARIIRIDRPVKPLPPGTVPSGMAALASARNDALARGRENIALDLKNPQAVSIALRLIDRADGLVEGFRPGVMESLGLGPDICLGRNPRLAYGRVTGWGQTGPLAQAAGHDINFLALSGALHMVGSRGGKPVHPPGMLGDFGGGGMLLAVGLLSAMLHARETGQGQVVDAAITEGAALLGTLMHGWRSRGLWNDEAGTNNGDGGAHFYNTYTCADGKHIAVGAMEPKFYRLLRDRCGLDDPAFDAQWDESQWPQLQQKLANLFASKTRQSWCDLLEGSDCCFSPVLGMAEAPSHPQHVARGSFVKVDGMELPAAAPRFSETPAGPLASIGAPGGQTEALLGELGFQRTEIQELLDRRVVATV